MPTIIKLQNFIQPLDEYCPLKKKKKSFKRKRTIAPEQYALGIFEKLTILIVRQYRLKQTQNIKFPHSISRIKIKVCKRLINITKMDNFIM